MKANVLNFVSLLLILAVSFFSCTEKEIIITKEEPVRTDGEETDEDDSLLKPGMYVEINPIPYLIEMGFGPARVFFYDKKRLVIILPNYAPPEECFYEICTHTNTIKLTHTSGETSEIYFRIIDGRKFEMGGLYIYTTDRPHPIMTFEFLKENKFK